MRHYADQWGTSNYILEDISVMPDQTLLVTGCTRWSWLSDYYALHLDGDGNHLAYRRFNRDSLGMQEGGAHALLPSGGFMLAGHTHATDVRPGGDLLRFDAAFDTLGWQIYHDSTAMLTLGGLCANLNGGVLLAGTYFHGQTSELGWWLENVDALGNTLWTRRYMISPPHTWDPDSAEVNAVAPQTGPELGYVVAGNHYRDSATDTLWAGTLLRLTLDGDSLWYRTYELPEGSTFFTDVVALPDGFLAVGEAWNTLARTSSLLVVRTDLAGDTLWTRQFYESGHTEGNRVLLTDDGNVTVLGTRWVYPESWALLYRLTPAGDLLWQSTYWVPITWDGGYMGATAIAIDAEGRYRVGFDAGSLGYPDAYLICTEPDPTLAAESRAAPVPTAITLSCYPNPFNNATVIRYALPRAAKVTLTVYDLLGREVAVLLEERVEAGERAVGFDGEGLASGVYLVRLQAGEWVRTRKVVLLK